MKPGGSTLNPYAKAYVPVARRESYPSNEGSRVVVSAPPHGHHQPYGARGYGVQGTGSFRGSQMSSPRDEDLETEMEINYLLVTFSGLSQDSINDVYLANNRDLDATIEMLTQLEIYSAEAQEYLPETLDIGDVPETTVPLTSTTANTEVSAESSLGIPKANVPSS